MKQIIISSLYLIVLFCLSTFVFDPAYLYYEIWWLDIPMHIMGGFGVAFLFSAIFSYYDIKVSYVKLLIAYTIVALSWESYEHIHNYMITRTFVGARDPITDSIDTLKDLLDGAIGMSVAYLFIKK